ncbi:hypothetical protein OSB04_006052 [Centaurea solstitialis]|uniref:Jacalin-type lectin domain-containing protein n=1 Tax=Centaurea solstitialis TaxID=347529 RepID=A0AA38U0B3_9ASTR|nr:hypothetical protein OSB04_006052 [Centaurea solstitialis]
MVWSLCFVTNKKRYGPYGFSYGTRFSYDGRGGVIVGFHGHADNYLDAIGIYVMADSLAFRRNSTIDEKSTHELCSSCLSRMVMPKEIGPFGASAGTCKDKAELASLVNLDGTDEYLTRISGFYGPVEGFKGLEAITSITFHTNKTIYGPYGEEGGDGYTYFTSTKSPGKVVGFHGRKFNDLPFRYVNLDGKDDYLTQISGFYGPIGGYDGLEANQYSINWSEICIDYPTEYLVSISGTYGSDWDQIDDDREVVQSLCFVTNKKRYGPYGLGSYCLDTGTPFSYNGKGGVIVGFHGRAGEYLDAIGVYVVPESLAFDRKSTIDEKSIHEVHLLVFLFCFYLCFKPFLETS